MRGGPPATRAQPRLHGAGVLGVAVASASVAVTTTATLSDGGAIWAHGKEHELYLWRVGSPMTGVCEHTTGVCGALLHVRVCEGEAFRFALMCRLCACAYGNVKGRSIEQWPPKLQPLH